LSGHQPTPHLDQDTEHRPTVGLIPMLNRRIIDMVNKCRRATKGGNPLRGPCCRGPMSPCHRGFRSSACACASEDDAAGGVQRPESRSREQQKPDGSPWCWHRWRETGQ
jgi:hypothetical protein